MTIRNELKHVVTMDETLQGAVAETKLRNLARVQSSAQRVLVWDAISDDWIPAESLSALDRVFATRSRPNGKTQAKILAFAGGKGGVGKTVLATSIGVGLASMGSEVILVDGDLAGPDLHTCMGLLEPEYTFFDFYTLAKDSLSEVVLETPVENLGLISGACGTLGVANPKYFQKQRFIRELKKLQADYVLLDLGAGASFNVIDFFLLADEKILVVSPEPTSIHEVFGFVKICIMRQLNQLLKNHPSALEILARKEIHRPGKSPMTVANLLDEINQADSDAGTICERFVDSFRPKLILNMVSEREDIKEGLAVQAAARELLSVNIQYLGYISFDPEISKSVKAHKPFLLYNPRGKSSQDLSALIRVSLLGKNGFKEVFERRRWRKRVQSASRVFDSKEKPKNTMTCSASCFYWGGCEYQDEGNPCRVRHLEPVLRQ